MKLKDLKEKVREAFALARSPRRLADAGVLAMGVAERLRFGDWKLKNGTSITFLYDDVVLLAARAMDTPTARTLTEDGRPTKDFATEWENLLREGEDVSPPDGRPAPMYR